MLNIPIELQTVFYWRATLRIRHAPRRPIIIFAPPNQGLLAMIGVNIVDITVRDIREGIAIGYWRIDQTCMLALVGLDKKSAGERSATLAD